MTRPVDPTSGLAAQALGDIVDLVLGMKLVDVSANGRCRITWQRDPTNSSSSTGHRTASSPTAARSSRSPMV